MCVCACVCVCVFVYACVSVCVAAVLVLSHAMPAMPTVLRGGQSETNEKCMKNHWNSLSNSFLEASGLPNGEGALTVCRPQASNLDF